MDSTPLRIITYNSQGTGISRILTLKDLCQDHDIVLVQEHWLHSSQLNVFEHNLPDMCVHSVSAITDTNILVGRPHGGVACLWKKTLKAKVTPVATNNNRLCAIKIEMIHITLLIICLYMPCDTNICHSNTANVYRDVLQCVKDLCDTEHVDQIILGGDLNTDRSRHNSVNR